MARTVKLSYVVEHAVHASVPDRCPLCGWDFEDVGVYSHELMDNEYMALLETPANWSNIDLASAEFAGQLSFVCPRPGCSWKLTAETAPLAEQMRHLLELHDRIQHKMVELDARMQRGEK